MFPWWYIHSVSSARILQSYHSLWAPLSNGPSLFSTQSTAGNTGRQLRCCVTTRPGFWQRTIPQSLTRDAASWFDACVRSRLSDIARAPINDPAWLHATLPARPWLHWRPWPHLSADHYASWAAPWANIPHMCPTAIRLATADLTTSALRFAHGLRSAHTSTRASPTYVHCTRGQPQPTPPPPPRTLPSLSPLKLVSANPTPRRVLRPSPSALGGWMVST